MGRRRRRRVATEARPHLGRARLCPRRGAPPWSSSRGALQEERGERGGHAVSRVRLRRRCAPIAPAPRAASHRGDRQFEHGGLGILGPTPDCPDGNDAARYETFRSTWGAALGERFDADVHGTAFSGKGVYQNVWRPDTNTMGVIYTRANPLDPTSAFDFASFRPDVVVLWFGANDFADGEPVATGPAPLPAFEAKLDELVGMVRAPYPHAHVFLVVAPSVLDATRHASVETGMRGPWSDATREAMRASTSSCRPWLCRRSSPDAPVTATSSSTRASRERSQPQSPRGRAGRDPCAASELDPSARSSFVITGMRSRRHPAMSGTRMSSTRWSSGSSRRIDPPGPPRPRLNAGPSSSPSALVAAVCGTRSNDHARLLLVTLCPGQAHDPLQRRIIGAAVARYDLGVSPVQRLNARKNAAGSE